MNNKIVLLSGLLYMFYSTSADEVNASASDGKDSDQVVEVKKLENPVTVQYLKTKLSKTTPRLVLTPSIEKTLNGVVIAILFEDITFCFADVANFY